MARGSPIYRFAQSVASFGARAGWWSEMVASVDMINARPGAAEKAELGFGRKRDCRATAAAKPAPMAEAARIGRKGRVARVIRHHMGLSGQKMTQGFSAPPADENARFPKRVRLIESGQLQCRQGCPSRSRRGCGLGGRHALTRRRIPLRGPKRPGDTMITPRAHHVASSIRVPPMGCHCGRQQAVSIPVMQW